MKLVTIDEGISGAAGALLDSGEIVHFARAAAPGTAQSWIPPGVREILAAGTQGMGIVRELVARVQGAGETERQALRSRGALLPSTTRLLAPVPNPRLLVAAGLAYHSHLREMSGTPAPSKPTGFMKSVNSITGPEADVTVPAQAPDFVDYEGELAVVIGAPCYRASVEQAMACVAGYTAANDISARDWVFDVFKATEAWPARMTWEVNIMGKQLPGFTPLGPVLATVDEFEDISKATLQTRLNGKVMQSVEFSDLIFSIGETLSYMSQWYAFEPGDVLLTGTPAGVGVGRKPSVFMKAGDVVEVEIDKVGVLRNTLKVAAG